MCGIQLATNRIYQVLPQRIQEWALSPCIAEEINKKELESVRRQQLEVRGILQELDKRHMVCIMICNSLLSFNTLMQLSTRYPFFCAGVDEVLT